jgi:DNA-binding FadR family transcriptional regulator
LAKEVVRWLQQQIAYGLFKVGEKLPTESELIENFGVGRSTIREAVKILSNSGLLNVLQGIGTFIESETLTPIG